MEIFKKNYVIHSLSSKWGKIELYNWSPSPRQKYPDPPSPDELEMKFSNFSHPKHELEKFQAATAAPIREVSSWRSLTTWMKKFQVHLSGNTARVQQLIHGTHVTAEPNRDQFCHFRIFFIVRLLDFSQWKIYDQQSIYENYDDLSTTNTINHNSDFEFHSPMITHSQPSTS